MHTFSHEYSTFPRNLRGQIQNIDITPSSNSGPGNGSGPPPNSGSNEVTAYTILDAPIDNSNFSDLASMVIDEDDAFIYLQTNNWPSYVDICGNDFNQFTTAYMSSIGYGGNNVPEARSEYISVQIPKSPTYPSTSNTYNYFTGELGFKRNKLWLALDEVAMQMWVVGMMGRYFEPLQHWSKTSMPKKS